MRVLKRWWGRDAMALALWQAETNSHLAQHGVAPLTDRGDRLVHIQGSSTREQLTAWSTIHDGSNDGLHLIHHAESPIREHQFDGQDIDLRPPAVSVASSGGAVLMLDTYDGWYHELRRVGRLNQNRDPATPWQVDVVVRAVGFIGRFHRSPHTGVWHAVTEEDHLLGWP